MCYTVEEDDDFKITFANLRPTQTGRDSATRRDFQFSANNKVSCRRRTKKHGKFQEITIPQPVAIHDYNQFMNGVDRSDQMLACHNVGKKCYRRWKTLFFHLVDIAVVNSFILFQRYREQHADVEGLQRVRGYSVVDFREALVRQICGWQEYDDPPA